MTFRPLAFAAMCAGCGSADLSTYAARGVTLEARTVLGTWEQRFDAVPGDQRYVSLDNRCATWLSRFHRVALTVDGNAVPIVQRGGSDGPPCVGGQGASWLLERDTLGGDDLTLVWDDGASQLRAVLRHTFGVVTPSEPIVLNATGGPTAVSLEPPEVASAASISLYLNPPYGSQSGCLQHTRAVYANGLLDVSSPRPLCRGTWRIELMSPLECEVSPEIAADRQGVDARCGRSQLYQSFLGVVRP